MDSKFIWKKDEYIIRLAKKEDAEKYYIENYCPLDKDRVFFLLIAPDGRIIGESVINELDWELKSANFRIAIFHAEERENGLGSWATEITRDFAFEHLKLERLELSVFSFNPRAEKVYTKAGFKREEIVSNEVLDGDHYADEIVMAITEKEWREMKDI